MLVVDDASVVFDCLELYFERYSTIQAEFTRKGHKAVEMCIESTRRECCGPYKLVLLDLHLEDMSSYEAAKQIREFLGPEETKIIGMTPLLEEHVKSRMELVGIDGGLYKPLSREKILQILQDNDIFNGNLTN